jgi:integrase/recombinase XerD
MSHISVISHTSTTELAPVTNLPSQQNPGLVYLASLSPGSRRSMRQALDVIADSLTSGMCDHRSMPWGALRFQHTQAVRAILLEKYSAATANKMLAALKQTLRAAWSLGYMDAEAYQRAIDLKSVKGEKPDAAAGRALSFGEWLGLFAACQSDPGPAGVCGVGRWLRCSWPTSTGRPRL